MGRNKILRSQKELILSLKKHTELLREYYNKAFIEGDKKYYGEIAGKLRLMVYSKGQKPLLIGLMDELKVDIPIVLGGPPIKPLPGEPGPGDKISLERYLELLAYAIRTPRGLVRVSKIDLIKIWAQQDGSAHEGWEHDVLDSEFARRGVSL